MLQHNSERGQKQFQNFSSRLPEENGVDLMMFYMA